MINAWLSFAKHVALEKDLETEILMLQNEIKRLRKSEEKARLQARRCVYKTCCCMCQNSKGMLGSCLQNIRKIKSSFPFPLFRLEQELFHSSQAWELKFEILRKRYGIPNTLSAGRRQPHWYNWPGTAPCNFQIFKWTLYRKLIMDAVQHLCGIDCWGVWVDAVDYGGVHSD